MTSFGMDAVDWLKSESEVEQPVTTPWVKSRPELKTVNK